MIKYFSNILSLNKKTLTIIYLKIIWFFSTCRFGKKLFETKDKKENNKLVELIKVKWSNLKDEIEKISKKNRKGKTR